MTATVNGYNVTGMRRKLALLAAITSALTLAFIPAADASTHPAPATHCVNNPFTRKTICNVLTTQYYIEMAYNSNWVINDTGGGTRSGTVQQLWYTGNTNEGYTLMRDSTGGFYYQMEYNGTGMCLNDKNGAYGAGSVVQLWQCSWSNQNNLWYPVQTHGIETWQNASNDACLDDKGNVHADGNPIQLWVCNGGPQQYWIGP